MISNKEHRSKLLIISNKLLYLVIVIICIAFSCFKCRMQLFCGQTQKNLKGDKDSSTANEAFIPFLLDSKMVPFQQKLVLNLSN
jgi:hypothetical protein